MRRQACSRLFMAVALVGLGLACAPPAAPASKPPAEVYQNSYQVVIHKDLAGQVRTVNDLRGLRLAINGPTALNHAWRALSYHGMRLEDVQIENVSFPEQLPALTNQAIDAAMPL